MLSLLRQQDPEKKKGVQHDKVTASNSPTAKSPAPSGCGRCRSDPGVTVTQKK